VLPKHLIVALPPEIAMPRAVLPDMPRIVHGVVTELAFESCLAGHTVLFTTAIDIVHTLAGTANASARAARWPLAKVRRPRRIDHSERRCIPPALT
jgi:hypothetical protein